MKLLEGELLKLNYSNEFNIARQNLLDNDIKLLLFFFKKKSLFFKLKNLLFRGNKYKNILFNVSKKTVIQLFEVKLREVINENINLICLLYHQQASSIKYSDYFIRRRIDRYEIILNYLYIFKEKKKLENLTVIQILDSLLLFSLIKNFYLEILSDLKSGSTEKVQSALNLRKYYAPVKKSLVSLSGRNLVLDSFIIKKDDISINEWPNKLLKSQKFSIKNNIRFVYYFLKLYFNYYINLYNNFCIVNLRQNQKNNYNVNHNLKNYEESYLGLLEKNLKSFTVPKSYCYFHYKIFGLGFRIKKSFIKNWRSIRLELGYSHFLYYFIENNVKFLKRKKRFIIFGDDHRLIKIINYNFMQLKKLNCYKIRGIKDVKLVIKMKQGKKTQR